MTSIFLKRIITRLLTVLLMAHSFASLWISVNGFTTGKSFYDYINGLYFLFSTASTIGYGDVTVSHRDRYRVNERYLFASFIILVSLIFFAYIQSLIQSLFHDLTIQTRAKQEYIEELDDWVASLQKPGCKITYHWEYAFKSFMRIVESKDVNRALSESGYVEQISPAQRERIEESLSQWFTKRFHFFNALEADAKVKIALKATCIRYNVIKIALSKALNYLNEASIVAAFISFYQVHF